MSKDVKLFCACDHVVDGKMYQDRFCPKCFGKNYYYDLSFNNDGNVITTQGEIKLQQEVLKIMNDAKGGNVFFPNWGNLLSTDEFIGGKNLKAMDEKIKMIVYQTLQHLKNVQINNQIIFENMTENEIIEEIEEIKVKAIPPSGYVVGVKFSNVVGKVYEQIIVL